MDSDDDDRFDHLPYAHVDGAEDTYVDMPNLQELQLLLGSLEEEILSQDARFLSACTISSVTPHFRSSNGSSSV